MAIMIEQIILTCSSIEQNSNKVWVGELYDNGDVITRWGRIRGDLSSNFDSLDSKTFEGAGESFLRKKEHEKLRPKKDKECYTAVPTVCGNSNGAVAKVDNLHTLAREQLAKNNPELAKLVDRLVKANIHNIVSQTSITYNSATGGFQTPLGPVTKEGIDKARNLLVEVKKAMVDKKRSSLPKTVSDYLRLIPHDFGMQRLSVELVFPDLDAVEKESNVLDSLEATLQSMVTPVAKPDSITPAPAQKVFEVDLDILNDAAECKRLEDFYHRSMKSSHGYGHVKIRQMFKVTIQDMVKAFNKALGNIQEVYHGTSQANLLSILKSGLKTSPPNTAYIAGKMWGNGVYGAINSSKSLGYTFGRWGGSHGESGWLFVCAFAMGKVDYPSNTRSRPSDGNDSIWAKASKVGLAHDELIVYRNNQVNICYLLECK